MEFNEWENKSFITHGQKLNLFNLFNRLGSKLSFEEYLNKKFNVENVDLITYKKYYQITIYIEKKIKLNDEELNHIKEHFTIEQLNDIIDVYDYNDIRLYDIRKLIKTNSDLNLLSMIQDRSNIPMNKTKVLKHTVDYEYGIQESKYCLNNEMYYLKYFDIMMLDYDNKSLEEIYLLLDKRFSYRIYKTFKGYHVFIVSNRINYNEQIQLVITSLFKADTMYSYYSYFNGYNIRLTPKIGYDERVTNEFIGTFGDSPADPDIENILINTLENNIYETNSFFYDKYLALEYPNIPKVPSTYVDYLIQNSEININSIKYMSTYFINYIKKPQRYLHFENDLYIGVDMNTNMHYICYKDIVMFDIDNIALEDIMPLLKSEDSYLIYKSNNGFHIFLTNRRIDYDSDESIKYMIEMKTDIKYIICSYLRGYSVRLNKKKETENIYELVYEHNKHLANKDIIELINIHIIFAEQFWNVL